MTFKTAFFLKETKKHEVIRMIGLFLEDKQKFKPTRKQLLFWIEETMPFTFLKKGVERSMWQAAHFAFAAIRRDGHIIPWGNPVFGGHVDGESGWR